jgi:hypothetical protein
MVESVIEAEVAGILARRKFVHKVIADNTKSKGPIQPFEKRFVCDIRFLDMPKKNVQLQFFARQEQAISGVLPRPRPGLSLLWRGVRIRGVNWALRHDSLRNGVPCGYIKGWHEKVWTNSDGDKHIKDINSEVGNTDLTSMIKFCCDRWNIEFKDDQFHLGGT